VSGLPHSGIHLKGRSQTATLKYPELAAIPWLRELERSAQPKKMSDISDVNTTALLDFGNAVIQPTPSADRWIPIAVSASGQAGDLLRFYRIEEEVIGTGERQESIPAIGTVETASWDGSLWNGAALGPIRQIRFAQHVSEQSEWMAVRFSSSTIIFSPLYLRHNRASYQKDDDGLMMPSILPSSRLDPNPVAEVPVSRTANCTHVHVAFNPWYQKQFSIIDEAGNWTIWNIGGTHYQRGNVNLPLKSLQSGSLPQFESASDQIASIQNDGWAIVEWVGSVNQILACNRHIATLYHVDNDHTHSHPLELGLIQKSEWILDVKKRSTNMSDIFILTTLRVLLVHVQSVGANVSGITQLPSYTVPLAWNHFRDPEDLSLQLSVLSMHGGKHLL
jgi:RNA polymerase I-specific transcription initiation factor RRN6